MGEHTMSVLIVGICFFSVVAFVKIVSDNKVRSKLIDKGMVDENVKYLYTNRLEYHCPAAMKWGMVLIGIGLAFLIGVWAPSDLQGEITAGSIFILAGLGLIIYYIIAKRMANQTEGEGFKK
jgi:hypothetical protein